MSDRVIHQKTWDHHPDHNAYARFNKRVAVSITNNVGSMTTAYAFAALALVSLPAALASGSLIVIVAWIAQTFLQLVLLPVIIVGQAVQSEAADARAAKTFDDTESILDRLSTETEGGLKTVLDAITRLGTTKGDA